MWLLLILLASVAADFSEPLHAFRLEPGTNHYYYVGDVATYELNAVISSTQEFSLRAVTADSWSDYLNNRQYRYYHEFSRTDVTNVSLSVQITVSGPFYLTLKCETWLYSCQLDGYWSLTTMGAPPVVEEAVNWLPWLIGAAIVVALIVISSCLLYWIGRYIRRCCCRRCCPHPPVIEYHRMQTISTDNDGLIA